mgnify:CR=1 FL=1
MAVVPAVEPYSEAGETLVFSWISYKSKTHRNQVNKKVMKDPRMNEMMEGKKMPFDVVRDFLPVTNIALGAGYLLVAHNNLPAKTLKDLGFGLEQYDTVGRIRTMDRGQMVDTSGEVGDTTTTMMWIDGVSALGSGTAMIMESSLAAAVPSTSD